MRACSTVHRLFSHHGSMSESAVLTSWYEHLAMIGVLLLFKEIVIHDDPQTKSATEGRIVHSMDNR